MVRGQLNGLTVHAATRDLRRSTKEEEAYCFMLLRYCFTHAFLDILRILTLLALGMALTSNFENLELIL
jgi:hypothetical protein